jgi:hypothetical protein
MVIGGIAGEGAFEYLAARAEGHVREIDSTVAISARDRADKAERTTATLQSVVMPLDLSDKQQSDIGLALKRYSGRAVLVSSNTSDGYFGRRISLQKARYGFAPHGHVNHQR